MKILIKNATVVFPDQTCVSNVLVENSTIVAVDAAEHARADMVVNARGLHLLPGLIDDQVHFREPGLTHKEDLAHASKACAKGGVTSFLEMPNTNPTTTTVQRLQEKLELASRSSFVNYGFYIGATPNNLVELQNAKRTPGIKIFIGSSTGDLLVDDQDTLERIFSETSLPICAHCEDEATIRDNLVRYGDRTDVAAHSLVRDHRAAMIATQRAIDLAVRHQHRFHILHVSTAAEAALLPHPSGLITAEVCPHHLFFNIDDYERLGALIKMNPSIKTAADNAALWQALLDGRITVVATDHAPHTLEEKQQPYPACPSGLPAVENSLALMLNQVAGGRCTIEQVVGWMSAAPAQVWQLDKKGSIEVGSDADLVLVDMQLSQTIDNAHQETKCRWSPWHGQQLTGWPVRTWVMGHEVFRLDDLKPRFDTSRWGSEISYRLAAV